jgi:hypothetical protein
MKKLRLIPVAVLSIAALGSAACATGYGYGDPGRYPNRGGYGYPDRGYYAQIERRAYDNGYREGVKDGQHDGRDRRRYEPTRHDDWRDADDGYRREYGDKNYYRRSFRTGYEAGYSEGYRQSDGYRYRRW